jgi:hypothetical protein
LQIERPDQNTPINRVITNANTDGNASVSLGVFVDRYAHEATEYGGASLTVMNVSMVGNTRMGIQYDYIIDDELYGWMLEDYTGPDVTVLQEFPNCGDDWGTWADLPWGFRFKFYGGKYRNYPEESLYSKVWICTNGFISFDVSNSTSSYPPVYFPNMYSPNAIIAPLWTDLKIDDQSKITTKTGNFVGNLYFIVIWKNALHKSTGKRLTFAVALKGYNWSDEENPSLLGGYIYMAYQDVKPINGVFTYGIEDHAGGKGTGSNAFGTELGALNGSTLIFHQSTSNYYIKHMALTFEDQSPNVRCKILDGFEYIRGLNMKTRIAPPPAPNEAKAWLKPILSTVKTILPYAGAATACSAVLGPVGMLIGFGLISWGFYDAYTLHQYNSIEWLELESGSHYAHIKVPSNSSVVEDASLDIVFYWLWDQPNYLSTQHSLTVTAIVECQEVETGRIANATTSLNIEVGPDNNTDFDSAYDIQVGTYGEDPMLYLGGYDQQDFYRIGLAEADRITVTMTPPYSQNFDLYLYNPAQQEKRHSTNPLDATETISYEAESTGYWFIEVRNAGGDGFYNMTVRIREYKTCPVLFVWNGTDYTEEGTLNIHAKSDITVQHQIQQTLVQDGIFYRLQLRELDNFTSHIDQVRLYAVDYYGEVHICPLIFAIHNQQNWITFRLRFDDDRRVYLAPTETIDLKFTCFRDDIEHFIFEINGYNKKIEP